MWPPTPSTISLKSHATPAGKSKRGAAVTPGLTAPSATAIALAAKTRNFSWLAFFIVFSLLTIYCRIAISERMRSVWSHRDNPGVVVDHPKKPRDNVRRIKMDHMHAHG